MFWSFDIRILILFPAQAGYSYFGFESRYWLSKSSRFDQVKVYFDVAVGPTLSPNPDYEEEKV
ncbi:MAG: hypothetical protein KKB35_10300, partial [Proteobacteria bacterium]|nr:hypothetical protein [Pseudomonadota bacterium]